jgi:RimJ/RimL family protein N-acetyltransferase
MAFTFRKGISTNHIKQLIKYSNDPKDIPIFKYTSDHTRFANQKSFDEWFAKGRTIYTATDGKDLVGIIWFGSKPIPVDNYSHDTTFAIRIYPKARGKGLSFNFMDYAFKNYQPKNTWLECSADNNAAVKLYTKFGFQPITSPDKNNKIIMILDPKN